MAIPMTNLILRYLFGAFSALVLFVSSVRAAENTDVLLIDHKTTLEQLKMSAEDLKRMNEFLATLPEDHKAEVTSTVTGGGDINTRKYICRLTAINSAGKPDGREVNYANWCHQPAREAQYENGVLQGTERTFEPQTRILLSETPWEEGKIHGVKRTFHSNGKLANEATFEKGTLTGQSRSFDPEGKLVRVVNFTKGLRDGDSTDYWTGKPDAVEKVVSYRKGKVHGVAKSFYLNGQLKWERPFKDDKQNGVEKQYEADGKLEKTLYWLDGTAVTEEDYRKKVKE